MTWESIPQSVLDQHPMFTKVLQQLVSEHQTEEPSAPFPGDPQLQQSLLEYKFLLKCFQDYLLALPPEHPLNVRYSMAKTKSFLHEHGSLLFQQEQDLKQQLESFRANPSDIQQFLKHVERELEQTAVRISHFVYPQASHEKAEIALAKFMQLPHLIRAQKQDLKQVRDQALACERRQKEVEHETYAILVKMVGLFQQLVERFLAKEERQRCEAYQVYFTLIVDNLHLKLRCLSLECSLTTYEPSTLEALHPLRERLIQLKEATLARLNEADAQLQSYAMAGDDFHQLVRTYHGLLKQMASVEEDLHLLAQ